MTIYVKVDCEEMKARYNAARAEKKRKKARSAYKEQSEYAAYAAERNMEYIKKRYCGKGGCLQ